MPSGANGAPDTNGAKSDGKGNGKGQPASNSDSPFLRNLDIPDGYKAVFVETGLTDDDYVEIKAGLNEGDTVVLPDVTVSSGFGMMMGGPGGGGPQGGPPSGGGDGAPGGGGSGPRG